MNKRLKRGQSFSLLVLNEDDKLPFGSLQAQGCHGGGHVVKTDQVIGVARNSRRFRRFQGNYRTLHLSGAPNEIFR